MDHDIPGLLNLAIDWRLNPDDSLCARISEFPLKLRTVSDSALNHYHPALADTLRENIKYMDSKRSGYPVVRTGQAQLLATLLLHGTISLVSGHSQNTHLFSKIHDIIEAGDALFMVRGTKLSLEHVVRGGTDIPIVKHATGYCCEVSKTFMDKAFPGWEQRWRIGTEVGVDMSDLMLQVFKPSVPRVEGFIPMGDNADYCP